MKQIVPAYMLLLMVYFIKRIKLCNSSCQAKKLKYNKIGDGGLIKLIRFINKYMI